MSKRSRIDDGLIWLLALRFENLYRRRSRVFDFNVVKRIVTGSCLAMLILIAINYYRHAHDYSRGASGFWIDKGELAYPVSEVTIAGNLKDMFMAMVPASDLDRNFGTAAPTLLIEGMTLAGA